MPVPPTHTGKVRAGEREGKHVKASEDCVTNVPGVFVAGDGRTKAVRQLTTAAADGAISAVAACSFIAKSFL